MKSREAPIKIFEIWQKTKSKKNDLENEAVA
jgi:hypothetical protein